MQGVRKSWNDVRGKGIFVAVLIAFCGAIAGHAYFTFIDAKTPGETHCYGGVCHRVHTLDETRVLIGKTVDIIATHYDAPGIDKYNVGQYTSSGEEFDAENPARAAAVHYPDGTELLVWHPENRRAAHIRVNDFGPFMGKRTLDVTRKVADNMGWSKAGVTTLKVTVIWVPNIEDPKYRKGRVYPASLGLIGVVEPHQHAVIVANLIASGPFRNRMNVAPPPVASMLPVEPPSFRPESIAEAKLRADEVEAGLGRALTAAGPIVLAGKAPPIPEPPVAQVADAGSARQQLAALNPTIEQALAQLPAPELARNAPVIEAIPPTPSVVIASVAEPLPARPTTQQNVAEASREAPNRSTVPNDDATVRMPSSKPVVASAEPKSNETERPTAAKPQTEPSVVPVPSVAIARVEQPGTPALWSSPLLWIGIGLMLSTLWGATTFGRSRRGQQAVAIATNAGAAPVALPDGLDVAKRAAAQAEADARELLARELAERQSISQAEADARDELARELALRELERDREAEMRQRLEAAIAAHESAVRDLAALEAGKSQRATPRRVATAQPTFEKSAPPPVARDAPAQIRAPAPVAAPVVAKAPAAPPPPRALATPEEMAKLPGIKDPKLAGAVLGLPGAVAYWGNTIISQMRLDGTVRSGSPLRVDGGVDGACYAPVVLVSKGATVTGMVAAETIIVLGKVSGILTGRNILVAESAEVDGEIFYQTMSIDPHAQCDVSFSRLAADADPIGLADQIYDQRMRGNAA